MKILLVDDELPIRSYLKTLVDWEGHGYELIEAENGTAAIEQIKNGDIRLVLLDITMPVLSGLDVLEWMAKNDIKCVVTLLTSHDEFSYAQKALRLGCFDYVLKTDITGESILTLVERMRRELSEGEQQEQHMAELETAAKRKALSELRDSVNYWLCGKDVPDESVKQYVQTQLGFEDSRCRYVLLEMVISDYNLVVQRYTDSDIVQFTQIFDGVLNELLEAHAYFYTEPQAGTFLVFLRFSRQDSIQTILSRTQTLTGQIDVSFRNLLGIKSSILYTLPFSFIKESKERYQWMERLRPHAFFRSGEEIFCVEDYNWDAEACDALLLEFERVFSDKLATRDVLEIETCFDDAVKRTVSQHICVDPVAFCKSCERCVARFLSDCVGDKRAAQPQRQYRDYAQLKEVLLKDLAIHCISSEDQNKNLLIKKALLMIQRHYSEDIGLEWLAANLWVNASYLSRVFSQEVGQPFTAYLNNYRIDQAKRLISSTNLKLYEVAEQVGFSSSIVFSSSFRKATGMTPSDFRNQSV